MKKITNFPWDYHVNEETQEVWVHIPGGYPTTLGLPMAITKFFPGYKGYLCTETVLNSLKTK